MKLIKTEDAVGCVLCHDITQIIPGVVKDAVFRKGHVVTREDIPVLLSVGKEHLYVWEKQEGMLHEDEAAEILRSVCQNAQMDASKPKEGKIELTAQCDGVLKVDKEKLCRINAMGQMCISSRHGNFPVKKGDKIAGMRVIPLVIEEEKMKQVKEIAGETPVFALLPFQKKKAALLSGGQKQRISIARIFLKNPPILILDEATSALDPNTTHSILNLIRDINKKLGITVIIITHQMSVVEETCNRVAILDNGTVVEQGEVSTVFAHPQSAAAKRLVFPDASDEIFAPASDEHRIRVVFNGAFATNTPLITKMAMDEGIAANILAASTRCIGDKVYGNMLLGIPGGDNELERASKYLQSMPDILVEEV